MSILIKDMEMPKSCDTCDFGRLRYSFPWTDRKHGWNCQVDFYHNGKYTKIREADYGKPVIPNDCPLIPVPPHGDLIDRDDFFATCPELVYGYLCITNDLVVIPAEEGE